MKNERCDWCRRDDAATRPIQECFQVPGLRNLCRRCTPLLETFLYRVKDYWRKNCPVCADIRKALRTLLREEEKP